MPRPSKKAERTEEILQAFQRCVAMYGLEGSTLERISEEAGLQRSLVRHFVGNRDDLVLQLAQRVVDQSDQQWEMFLAWLPEDNMAEALLESFFSSEASDQTLVLVVESLIFASSRNPQLLDLMQQWMNKFTDQVYSLLCKSYPKNEPYRLKAVAFALISLYFNLDALSPLNMGDEYRPTAIDAARILLDSLEEK